MINGDEVTIDEYWLCTVRFSAAVLRLFPGLLQEKAFSYE